LTFDLPFAEVVRSDALPQPVFHYTHAIFDSGTIIGTCIGMIRIMEPHSDIFLSPLREEIISRRILTVRGHSVMLDSDLATLYRVTTRALNQAVKRNAGRFPEDFAFRITTKEKEEVVTKCDHLSRLKFSPVLPFAYTEHGTIMAASVLNSQTAVETSVFIVRAFVRMRETMASHRELAQRLNALEKTYGARFRVVFDAIRALMEPPKTPRRRIGF
jgi:ORF6N domain